MKRLLFFGLSLSLSLLAARAVSGAAAADPLACSTSCSAPPQKQHPEHQHPKPPAPAKPPKAKTPQAKQHSRRHPTPTPSPSPSPTPNHPAGSD